MPPSVSPHLDFLQAIPATNFMKPNTQTSRQSDQFGMECSLLRRGSNHPLIDYQFRTSQNEAGRVGNNHKQARSVLVSGFRALSNTFFETEAKKQYVVEALCFALIVAISAWPIVSMIRALADFVK